MTTPKAHAVRNFKGAPRSRLTNLDSMNNTPQRTHRRLYIPGIPRPYIEPVAHPRGSISKRRAGSKVVFRERRVTARKRRQAAEKRSEDRHDFHAPLHAAPLLEVR